MAKIAIGEAHIPSPVVLSDDVFTRAELDGCVILDATLRYRLQKVSQDFELRSTRARSFPRAKEVQAVLKTLLKNLGGFERALDRLNKQRTRASVAAYVEVRMCSLGAPSPHDLHRDVGLFKASLQRQLHMLPDIIYDNKCGRERNTFLNDFIAEIANVYQEAGGRAAGRNSYFTAFVWALREAFPKWLKQEMAASREALGERIRREIISHRRGKMGAERD